MITLKVIVWDVQSSFEELRKSNHKLREFYASAPLTQGVYRSHGHAFPKGQISTNGRHRHHVLILFARSAQLFLIMMAGILEIITPVKQWMFISISRIHFGTQRSIASCRVLKGSSSRIIGRFMPEMLSMKKTLRSEQGKYQSVVGE